MRRQSEQSYSVQSEFMRLYVTLDGLHLFSFGNLFCFMPSCYRSFAHAGQFRTIIHSHWNLILVTFKKLLVQALSCKSTLNAHSLRNKKEASAKTGTEDRRVTLDTLQTHARYRYLHPHTRTLT